MSEELLRGALLGSCGESFCLLWDLSFLYCTFGLLGFHNVSRGYPGLCRPKPNLKGARPFLLSSLPIFISMYLADGVDDPSRMEGNMSNELGGNLGVVQALPVRGTFKYLSGKVIQHTEPVHLIGMQQGGY